MMNGLQTLPQWRSHFNNPEGAVLGLLNSIYPVGKVVALFFVTYISDRYGRKTPLYIGFITCISFAIMQGLSNNLVTFLLARCLLGGFTSFLSQPSPILITELAYPTHRGKITAMYNTAYVCLPRYRFLPFLLTLLTSCVPLVFWSYLCRLVYLWHLQTTI